MSSDSLLHGPSGSARIASRTPMNIAPILDAGMAQVLKRLLHETFASAAKKFAPAHLRAYNDELAALGALWFHFLSLSREGGALGESLYWVAREGLLLQPPNAQAEGPGSATATSSASSTSSTSATSAAPAEGAAASGPSQEASLASAPAPSRGGLVPARLALLNAFFHVSGPYVDNRLAKLREHFLLRALDDERPPATFLDLLFARRPRSREEEEREAARLRDGRDDDDDDDYEDLGRDAGASASASASGRDWRVEEVCSGRFWRGVFLRTYPAVKFSLGLWDVWQRIGFISGLSKWPTLEHFLIESNVRRLTFGEWDAQNKLREALRRRRLDRLADASGHGGGFKRWLALRLLKGKFFLEDYNKVALVGFAVGCKALEWWCVLFPTLPRPPLSLCIRSETLLEQEKCERRGQMMERNTNTHTTRRLGF